MLQVKDLQVTFNARTPNEVKSLQGVSFTLNDGDFAMIVGTNGSGKSTLLNMIAGTVFPDEGRIVLNGLEITSYKEHRRARFVGRVFQNPFSGTAPDMSIAENLTLAARRGLRRGLGPSLHKHVRDLIMEKVRELNMGLEDRLDSPIGKLSGGQRQALTLLMATWKKPDLLLLDEHTAALDPKTASLVVQLTREIIEKDNLTTLMVTHSMQQAVNLGNRLLMMHQGKIVHDFSGEDKKRLKSNDLLQLFDEIRRKEQVDLSAAGMLSRLYV